MTCDHQPELAALRQTVTGLAAERDSLARELTDVKIHRAVIAAQLTEMTRLNQTYGHGVIRVPQTEEATT